MKYQSTGRWTKRDVRRFKRLEVAARVNDIRMQCGAPTDLDTLTRAVEAEKWARGEKIIARNLIEEVHQDAERERTARAARVACNAAVTAWARSLPDGTLFAVARRGGYVAVRDGILVGRFTDGEEEILTGQPYMESPTRPLRSAPLLP